jgi:hypothetical protein
MIKPVILLDIHSVAEIRQRVQGFCMLFGVSADQVQVRVRGTFETADRNIFFSSGSWTRIEKVGTEWLTVARHSRDGEKSCKIHLISYGAIKEVMDVELSVKE